MLERTHGSRRPPIPLGELQLPSPTQKNAGKPPNSLPTPAACGVKPPQCAAGVLVPDVRGSTAQRQRPKASSHLITRQESFNLYVINVCYIARVGNLQILSMVKELDAET